MEYKYRIIYWLGSMLAEYTTKANSEEEAILKFKNAKGSCDIVTVEAEKM